MLQKLQFYWASRSQRNGEKREISWDKVLWFNTKWNRPFFFPSHKWMSWKNTTFLLGEFIERQIFSKRDFFHRNVHETDESRWCSINSSELIVVKRSGTNSISSWMSENYVIGPERTCLLKRPGAFPLKRFFQRILFFFQNVLILISLQGQLAQTWEKLIIWSILVHTPRNQKSKKFPSSESKFLVD